MDGHVRKNNGLQLDTLQYEGVRSIICARVKIKNERHFGIFAICTCKNFPLYGTPTDIGIPVTVLPANYAWYLNGAEKPLLDSLLG